jgi:D-lactate dehydrogenase (cytochrome)
MKIIQRKTFSTAKIIPGLFYQKLIETLPHVTIDRNKYELDRHGRGESWHPTAAPETIVIPQMTKDVSEILKLCNKYRVPIIPFGAGTSVEGHVSALQSGSISLDMMKFKDIDLPQDGTQLQDPFVSVGAGVTRKELNERLRHTGLQFMVDPGADATIGGMVSCGASGTTAVKYGTMRENILGVECVLADGTVAQCGTKALKSSAGYDLTSLMCGSEGTLGVITKVTVKLHPVPAHVSAAICSFRSLHDAAEAVAAIKMYAIPVERCELLDESSLRAFRKYVKSSSSSSPSDIPVPEKSTLFLEFTGSSKVAVEEQVSMVQSICYDFNGSGFTFTEHEEGRKALWAARHQLYYSSIALRDNAKGAIVTDVCVPLSKFADIISATVEDVKDLNVIGPCFGHAGDGNFHCILPLSDGDSEEYISKLHEINDRMIRRAMAVGGTCTGEHGVGYGKMKYLEKQYGSGGVEMMKMIKTGLDPNSILNPGKVVQIS